MHGQNFSHTIAALFAIRDKAHALHLKTKSFAQHVALGEFYEKLVDLTDDLAETHMGKYGIDTSDAQAQAGFDGGADAKEFIKRVTDWMQQEKQKLSPEDSFLVNIWDEITALAFRTRYKLENLS